MGLSARSWIFAFAVLSSIISVASLGQCNPIAPPIGPPPSEPHRDFAIEPAGSGFLMLYMLNIFVNLAFYTLFLLVFSGHRRARRLFPNAHLFALGVVGIVLAITLVGVVVDYYLVMRDGVSYFHPEDLYLSFGTLNWLMALTIIFMSVALPTVGLLRVSPLRSVLLGAGMCGMNLALWVLALQFGYDVAFISIFTSVLLSPVLLKILVDRYHSAPDSEVTGGPGVEAQAGFVG